ncbi:hypothetical protein VNO77_15098 [Canavalia gladiata]|uniref:Uncharacterized protein n=1 Tax=Canavalia gladiata TaxID=3824 RepID=A0AAN9M402_CANGL
MPAPPIGEPRRTYGLIISNARDCPVDSCGSTNQNPLASLILVLRETSSQPAYCFNGSVRIATLLMCSCGILMLNAKRRSHGREHLPRKIRFKIQESSLRLHTAFAPDRSSKV